MKEPYCFSRHLNAHPSSSEQLESVPERKGFARSVTSMNLSMVSHCRPPARGQPGRVGQERVMQHQVGVAPTHIAPVRSCVPLSRKAWLRVLTQPVPEVLIVNRNRSALARRLDSPYLEELENPGIETRVIGGGVHREPSASDGSSVREWLSETVLRTTFSENVHSRFLSSICQLSNLELVEALRLMHVPPESISVQMAS